MQEEISISENYSKLLNEAYTTLRDPLKRGVYLLKLHGLSIEDDKVDIKQDFLFEIMEKNEDVEKIQDSSSLKKEISLNNKMQEQVLNEVMTAFQDQDFSKARLNIAKLKYYVNIDEKLREKKSTLGVVD